MESGATEPVAVSAPGQDRLILPGMLKAIAGAQVWGAATGTWYVLQFGVSLQPQARSFLVYLILLLALAFYTLSGASALFLLRGRHWALEALAVAQLPQLIRLQSPSFIYTLISGIYGLVYVGSTGAGVNVGVLSTFTFRWGDLDVGTSFGFNVVAAATLWYLEVVYPSRAAESRRFPLRPSDDLGRHE